MIVIATKDTTLPGYPMKKGEGIDTPDEVGRRLLASGEFEEGIAHPKGGFVPLPGRKAKAPAPAKQTNTTNE